jgi:hypothetical protein
LLVVDKARGDSAEDQDGGGDKDDLDGSAHSNFLRLRGVGDSVVSV